MQESERFSFSLSPGKSKYSSMKTIILCCFILAGCSHPSPRPHPAADETAIADYFGATRYDLITNALASAETKRDVLPAIAALVWEENCEMLSHQSRTSLLAKLETLHRGANHHNYTQEQLEEAIRRQDTRRGAK